MSNALNYLRTNEDKVQLALELATKGMSIRKMAEVLKSKPSTVMSWISKALDHCKKDHKAKNW